MTHLEIIKVLLVEDDEDDFILTRALLSEIQTANFQLDWFKSYQAGLDAMIGLEPVKRQVRAITAQLRVAQLRQEQGLATHPPMRHFVFAGPPAKAMHDIELFGRQVLPRLQEIDR